MNNLWLSYPHFIFEAFAITIESTIIDTRSSFSCDCDDCEASKVIAIEDSDNTNDRDSGDLTEENTLYTEDLDGDGNRTICARDRDIDDRSFPSMCHMICHNNCSRYRIWIYTEKMEKKYIASVFRTSEDFIFKLLYY